MKKNKAVLFTAYSGKRVSEVCNLRLTNIDSGRMQILIRKAKAKKDRHVTLSLVLLDILRNYLQRVQPRPFEGRAVSSPYPPPVRGFKFFTMLKRQRVFKSTVCQLYYLITGGTL